MILSTYRNEFMCRKYLFLRRNIVKTMHKLIAKMFCNINRSHVLIHKFFPLN